MNDADDLLPDDLPPDDAAVLAVLDGDATPEQVARVGTDPVLRELLAAHRDVQAQLASDVVPPLPDLVARRSLEVALAAFDEPAGTSSAVVPAAAARAPAVAPSSPRSARPAPRLPSVAWLGAAAAVVALVAGGALALGDRSTPGGDEAAASFSADDTTGETAAADQSAAEEGSSLAQPAPDGDASGGAGAATTAAASGPGGSEGISALPDLGTIDDPAALRQAAVGLTAVAARISGDRPPLSVCEADVLDAEPAGTTAQAVARLTYQGAAALVVALRAPGGDAATELVVLDEVDCTPVTRLPVV